MVAEGALAVLSLDQKTFKVDPMNFMISLRLAPFHTALCCIICPAYSWCQRVMGPMENILKVCEFGVNAVPYKAFELKFRCIFKLCKKRNGNTVSTH